MNEKSKALRIVFSVALQDAGESTRSLEIAKGIQDLCPYDINLEIIFLSNGGRFEKKILESGFVIHKCEPQLEGVGFHADLKPSSSNFVGDEKLAEELLRGEIKALGELKPDFIIHGFWPFAGITKRVLNIPSICFLPIPFEANAFATFLMKDVPDQAKLLTYLPASLRKTLFKAIPRAAKLKAPILKQTNILRAIEACGIKDAGIENLFDMLRADLTIVNDLDVFYEGQDIPKNYKIVGPLYSPGEMNEYIDPILMNLLKDDQSDLKIYCTMGSSGTKKQLLEAIDAIASIKDCRRNAIVLSPASVCPLDEALEHAKGDDCIYITDKFLPAPFINSMVDVVVSHGGQGTVQTAIANGTPIVGVAMQPEQQINLDNAAAKGSAIRIPIHRWNATNIKAAIKTIQNNSQYRENAGKLQKMLNSIDGKKNSAQTIWDFINKKLI